MRIQGNSFCVFAIIGTLLSCDRKGEEVVQKTLFEKLHPSQTGVHFRNDLPFDSEFNIFTYRNFYNGGGVAIGDINNDSLPDLYLCSNLGKNKLYLNKGDFKFEDITTKSGVEGKRAWSTGVTMADVNGDGLLDIYICNSGDIKNDNRQNELFINNGDLTFTERAEEYGLADQGYSTHAAFFDYDKDGDLDMYLLNNSFQAIGSFNQMKNIRHQRDKEGGDKLFRNDNNKFVDVSEEAGIYGSVIGFGLGVTVGDVNNDGWLDMYISNDFFERDYLYLNNKNGTFREALVECMPTISAASMGADMADFNNDGLLDIFVTDMLPEDEKRLKQITTFENWDKISYNVKNGYHFQYNRNMLHLNNGDGTFSDVARLANVEATDWSWGALFFDMDNDGWKDIFVANGIYQDITDLDYLSFIVDENTVKKIISRKGVDYKALIEPIPINPISNYAFRNNGRLQFENKAEAFGLGEKCHSNGAAYGDLDNDGALDLVVNNVNNLAFIYRNNARSLYNGNGYLKVVLHGEGKNTRAIGTRVEIKANSQTYYYEQLPTRGFESSVEPVIVAGVGATDVVDSVIVKWPDDRITTLTNVKPNQTIHLNQKDAQQRNQSKSKETARFFTDITKTGLLPAIHQENAYVDFDRDRLTYHMLSTLGPRLAVGDVNGDGREDVYLGGAKGIPGQILFQRPNGQFVSAQKKLMEEDRASEDVDAAFVDIDGDRDLDLYVVTGGNEFSLNAPELKDKIYLNDGKGNFSRAQRSTLSFSAEVGSVVIADDFDKDNDTDLFVGSRIRAFYYGVPAGGMLYRNNGKGEFENTTEQIAPELIDLGMITDAVWTDYDGDNDSDLIVVGEWMAIEVFKNNNGVFKRTTSEMGLAGYKGWWNRIVKADIDGDGDDDFVLGNHGLNSRFVATTDHPMALYVNDFDGNGSVEHVLAKQIDGNMYPFPLRHDLVAQMPQLKKRYLKYKEYNDKSLNEIFSPEQLKNAKIWHATWLQSAVLKNDNGKLILTALPVEAQISPVYAIAVEDFDGDEKKDILLGGNLYEAKPEAGRYDASYGVLLKGNGQGNFVAMPNRLTGLKLQGAVRDFKTIRNGHGRLLLVAMNNDTTRVIRVSK